MGNVNVLKPDDRIYMTDNVAALRQLLLSTPRAVLPMTYQQVASALALTPPQSAGEVTVYLRLAFLN